jgi:translocation and assembly module TamB
MRRFMRRAAIYLAGSALLFAATALPARAQDTTPAAPDQPLSGAAAPASAPPAAGGAQQPAAQPDVSFTASLRIGELRFAEPPQASIQVVVQPGGQPLVDLQLENVPAAPQAGTTYRDVGVRLTVTGALVDVAVGAAGAPNPGASPDAAPANAPAPAAGP